MDLRSTPPPVDADGQNRGSGALLALEESRQEIARLRALLEEAQNQTQNMSPPRSTSRQEDVSFALKAMRLRTSGPSFTHSSEASRAGPPAAIGHTAVSYHHKTEDEEGKGKEGKTMVIFGGSQVPLTPATDDKGLYGAECVPKRGLTNDVWSFSDKKGWAMMRCEGEIPAPRACHAAAVVGDTMYVYGGYREVTAGQQVPHVPFYPSPKKKDRSAKSNNTEGNGEHTGKEEEENDGGNTAGTVSTGLPTIASDCMMSPARLGKTGKSKRKRREKTSSNKDKAAITADAAASTHHPQHLCTLCALDLPSGKWRSVVPAVKGGTDMSGQGMHGGACMHAHAGAAAASSSSRRTATISGHVACAAKGKVYFFGGSEVKRCPSTGSLSDPSEKTEKRGKSDPLVEAVNTVRCYDPRRNSWEDEADLNWQMEQQRRRQCHEGGHQEDGGADAEVDNVVPPPFTNCLCALCAELASTAECKTHRTTASVSYSQNEDAFYLPLVVYGPSPSKGGGGSQLACRVYRYDRVRREWSVLCTTGIGPTSRRGSFSSAIVGRLLIVFRGHNVNVLDTAAGHWYEVTVAQHSRSLPDGTGRSCVVVDHTDQGQPGEGSQQLGTQTRNRGGVSLLLFGGLKYKRTKQDNEDREDKDKARGHTKENDVAEGSPSRDLWRVDILPNSESAIPLFAVSGGTSPARNHSNNGTRSGNVGAAKRKLLYGPPRCASISPTTPRRPAAGGADHQTSPSPTRANNTSFIAPSPPSAAAGNSGRSHSRGRSGSQQLCDKSSSTNNPRWASLHPKPFSSQTSRHVSRQYFSTYSPHHTSTANSSRAAEESHVTAPSPKKKSAEEIKKIVERVSDTRVLDVRRKQLEARYLFSPNTTAAKTAALTAEEEEASVNRLYYEELEAREERQAELEQKYYPPPPVPDLTEDEVYESVERLYSARNKVGGLLPSVHLTTVKRHGSSSSSTHDADPNEFDDTLDVKSKAPPLSAHEEAAVKRLYYDQLAKSRESRIALEERYMREWGKKSEEHKHA